MVMKLQPTLVVKAITYKNTQQFLSEVVVLKTYLVFVTTSSVVHLTALVLKNVVKVVAYTAQKDQRINV